MLRLHFTYEDLANVVFSENLPPMSEAVLSLQVLSGTNQEPRFAPWRARLPETLPSVVRPLRDLVPARGWIPDFLTPVFRGNFDSPGELDLAAVEAVRSTPLHLIRSDLSRLATSRPLPGWVRALADGDGEAMAAVAKALVAWNKIAVAPHERGIQAALDADRARRTALATRDGIDAVLRRLHPAATWRPPVLTLPSAEDVDVHLAGRGLRLVPMMFCGPLPRVRIPSQPDARVVLACRLPFDPYSVNPIGGVGPERSQRTATALGRLLGGTRSVVFQTIAHAHGLTTAELAQRADVAMASASEHATVLREAGLISSHREGNRVRHYATATGTALLYSLP